MRIGILGSGLMGGKLGTLFARAGHEVVFSRHAAVILTCKMTTWYRRFSECLRTAADCSRGNRGKRASGMLLNVRPTSASAA
jgi:3-hydroxyacyl-CoA dehydrogenase